MDGFFQRPVPEANLVVVVLYLLGMLLLRIMPDTESAISSNRAEGVLKFILRLLGANSLLGLVFVFVPYSIMDGIHQWLGMGQLPDEPIVGYLARSTSAFYALLGGLMWVVSFDIRRHRNVLTYLSIVIGFFGILLIGVDWMEGMPLFWKVWEGPFVTFLGILMFCLIRRTPAA